MQGSDPLEIPASGPGQLGRQGIGHGSGRRWDIKPRVTSWANRDETEPPKAAGVRWSYRVGHWEGVHSLTGHMANGALGLEEKQIPPVHAETELGV